MHAVWKVLYSHSISITLQISNELKPTRESHRCGRLLMISLLCIITAWLKAASSQKRPDVHGGMAGESIDLYQLCQRVEVPQNNAVEVIDQLR